MNSAWRAELLLLRRRRLGVVLGSITVAFSAVTTTAMIATATADNAMGPAGGTEGLSLSALAGPGGATAAVTRAIVGFGFVVVLATFVSRVGNDFSRGTFRTALLHHPGRWSLLAGKVAALLTVALGLIALGIATGVATAAIVAPRQGIDTTGWFGVAAVSDLAIESVRIAVWATGWAFIATALAVTLRSTPFALGAGILWFGPIENVLGDDLAFARRWFPGLLLRRVVTADAVTDTSLSEAAVTLGVYACVLAAVVAVVFGRRDVTS